MNEPLASFVHNGSQISRIDRLGVEIHLQEFGISIESKPSLLDGILNKKPSYDLSNRKSIFIVRPFSTRIQGAALFAILGGSGSGKTTLLNVLAKRFDSSAYQVHGSIKFSQRGCNIGYVTQFDFLLPHLTVRETLLFTAKLKISPSSLVKLLYNVDISTPQDVSYNRLVENVIMDLGLKECADSYIGVDALVDGKRGISGGEKRRVSVGLQILTDPEVLCADEPTSGLDSFTAITLMESLKRLTKQSRKTTVVCSIHQPRADVFNIFDSVLILSKGGSAIYCGPTSEMIEYFQKIGYECPAHANPADFFVDLSSVDVDDGPAREESLRRVQTLIHHFQEKNSHHSMKLTNTTEGSDTPLTALEKEMSESRYHASYFRQFFLLLNRFSLNNYRDSSHFYGGLAQAMIVGFIITGIFWQLGDSQADMSSREGLMYITISMENYLTMIIFIERYCRELKILDRELQDDLYHPVVYLAAHVTSMIPQLLIQPIVYSIPIYFGCGLRPGINNFLMYTAVNIVLCFVINGLVWMCLSIQRLFALASLIANLNFTFISLTAGFLVNFDTMPNYVTWVTNISFLSYAYKILMSNEFTNRSFGNCDPGSTSCISGNAILAADGVTQNDYYSTWPAIFLIGLGYYTVAALLLTFLRFPPTGSVTSIEISDTEETVATNPEEEQGGNSPLHDNENHKRVKETIPATPAAVSTISRPEITITVRHLQLSVQVSRSSKYPTGEKKILKNIHVELPPGRLIALMGGSGSGKTTLLNLIANRIPHSSLRRHSGGSSEGGLLEALGHVFSSESNAYHGTGQVLFNGRAPSAREVRYLIGYGESLLFFILLFIILRIVNWIVPQFDVHLPSLTVYETLYYQAKLRLPLESSAEMIEDRIQEVIKTLGLLPCARIQVGNEEKKGISGGEKRRVSIGIQLLSNPSICLFDEPTTGLDAFTARHIVQTLKKLATSSSSSSSSSGTSTSLGKRTVVLSIHQPRYDIFACVDEVTLLSRGEMVWSGPVSEMLRHFQQLGYPCPALVNPADFILDLSSLDFRSEERETQTRSTLAVLVQGFETRRLQQQGEVEDLEKGRRSSFLSKEESSASKMVSFASPAVSAMIHPLEEKEEEDTDDPFRSLRSSTKPTHFSLPLIFHRSWTNLYRSPKLFFTRIYQGIFFALILSCFYAPIGQDQNSIQNRIGNLYELTATCFIGMLNCIDIFPMERNVFYREYMDGMYSSYVFVMSYLLIAMPMVAIGAFLMALLMTCAIGLKAEIAAVFGFTYILWSFMFVGECLGVIFCSAFSHIGFSLNLVSAVISFFSIMAGFISVSMPQFLTDLSNISPMYWGAYLLANLTFEDETFTCDEESIQNGSCLTTGDQVLELYHFTGRDGPYGMTFHYWMLGLITAIYFGLSIVAMRIRAKKISH